MSRALSGLTTRGRCLMAAGVAAALCSVILNERDLLRVSAFVIALPLLAAALTSRVQVGLRVRRTLHPHRAPASAQVTVSLALHNPRGRAAGLAIEDGVPPALGRRPRFAVQRLRGGRSVELRYTMQPALRGVHEIGPVHTMVADPFGLAEYERTLPVLDRLTVLPMMRELSGLPSGSGLGVGDDGTTSRHAGHGEQDAVVRQYRHGDDLRKVHWRSTARRDELMVRVEEQPWRGGTTVLLDHRADAHRGAGQDASLEWAISFVASVCAQLGRYERPMRLVTEDGTELAGGHTQHTGGLRQEDTVLDVLAALHPTHRRDLVCAGDPGSGQELIAVFGALTAVAAGELTVARPHGVRSLAVLLDVASWPEVPATGVPDPAEAANLLRGAGWVVQVVRHGDLIADVWQALVTRTSGAAAQGALSW